VSTFLDNTGNKKVQEIFSKLFSCIKALKAFENKYNKKLNLDKLFALLQIPTKERKLYVELILNFQELFHTVLRGYEVKVIEANNCSYIKSQKRNNLKKYNERETNNLGDSLPEEIILTKTETILWNDIIYLFKNVRRGKGFHLSHDTSEMNVSLKKLKDEHPYLIFSNGNGLVYPSKFGMELGSKINSYIKANRDINEINLLGCKISIKE